ncbi:hypothetical protein GCM10023320_53610 [Pseudonocardia adelaidensis]|uniref:CHAT domain-containing protein n=2 Tax=Pseudonocardia adelaidensis TaxID=648754 RepID=A0ABP9NTH9_9PSEU
MTGRLGQLTVMVFDEAMTMERAFELIRAERESLPVGEFAVALADDCWEYASTRREIGCVAAGLLHEWVLAHSPHDRAAVYASARSFVRAAAEVLIGRDDGALYRRASHAASLMVAAASPEQVAWARRTAGQLALAPYALDPVDEHHDHVFSDRDDYEFGRWRRAQVERSSSASTRPGEHVMPEPRIGLRNAVMHLSAAAAHSSGEAKGKALAHLAFAEYSRHLAGCGDDLATVDRLCDESAALLSPTSDPLASNRLLWLYIMRRRFDSVAGRMIAVPRELLPDGLAHTVLVVATALRIHTMGRKADPGVWRTIIDIAFPWVAADPHLQPYRRYFDVLTAHSLPGDPRDCDARRDAAVSDGDPDATSVAADRLHALLCGPGDADLWAEGAALEAVRSHAPELDRTLGVVIAFRRWKTAVRAADHQGPQRIPAYVDAVVGLALNGSWDLALVALQLLESAIRDEFGRGADLADPDLLRKLPLLVDVAFERLPEGSWPSVITCLSMLVRRWSEWNSSRLMMFGMMAVKGRALGTAIARAGPRRSPSEVVRCVDLLSRYGTGAGDAADLRLPGRHEFTASGFLQGAERESGSLVEQQRANIRRRAQDSDFIGGYHLAPRREPDEVLEALPQDGILLSVVANSTAVGEGYGVHAVFGVNGRLRAVSAMSPGAPTEHVETSLDPRNVGHDTTIHSPFGLRMGGLRSALLDEPLHRAVTREAESGLSYFGSWILHPVAVELLESLVSQGGYSRILFSPHEALHLFPLHLTPFRDGILADHFTVTVLPSLECLFSGSRAAEAKAGGVSVVACAAGGLGVGLPEEPSLHEQAERIAGLFGSRPLTGDNATPDAALDVLGAARYLHLAAHGVPDHDAPLFSRVYLAGGQLHAYEVLERDLRGVELVTLSACESALLRYDFFDNLHGLVPAFLRAGARAVVGALWPVEPDVAVTFFGELYAHLAAGVDQVAAFRAAQNTARERHPNYRDWGGFSYFGR